ncbi:macrophage-capping protein isoform 3-T3 [Morphnus guianensis]
MSEYIWPLGCLSVGGSVCLPGCPFIGVSVCPWGCPPIRRGIHLYLRVAVHPSGCPLGCPSVHRGVRPSIHPTHHHLPDVMYTVLPKSGSPFGPSVTHPGLHIWRVEKLQLVEVPEATWGVFFSGDAYLVLHNGPDERAHLHLWMGRDSSRDEQGACALLSTQLNTLLGERPVTHREVQGNESDIFMEYFPRGVTYQVKGKKNIRASERDLSWASFNTGDCFILDLGETLFVWCGARCNVLERGRAQELAAAIRDGERGGKARLEIVADGEEPPEMLQVLGPKPTLQEGSPEEDIVADQRNAGAAVLYKVSDATGRMDLSQVAASSPFSQSLLCSDDCFVLDNGAGGKVYVWKGRKANEQERQAALKVAEEVIARMGHSPQTQVEILPQGRETPLFKQFFTSWK